jgi:hypothetical protein
VRPYLSTEQLCAITPWTPDALDKLVRRGMLKRGVHYFQPLGRRSRLIFKWSAIVELIEGFPPPHAEVAVIDAAHASRPRLAPVKRAIDVEKATTNLQRLLA